MKNKIQLFFFLFCVNILFAKENFIIIESVHPHDFNPQTTSYNSDITILSGLYEGLFSYNPATLEPVYALCESYKISRDKKRWTFKIRQNAKFSNGEQINSSSVRESWLLLLETQNAPYSSLLDIIRGAKEYRTGKGIREDVGIYIVDDFTLNVSLNMPASYFPKILCNCAFSVIHRNPTVFSGSYILENITENSTVLTKNQFYWDEQNVKLPKITFIQSDNIEENTHLFNNGDVDWISSSFDSQKVIDKKSVLLNAVFGTTYFFFKNSIKKSEQNNQNQKNLWDYPEFRNALIEAVPWEVLRKDAFFPAETLVFPLTNYPLISGFNYTDEIEALLKMKAARKKYNIPDETQISLKFLITQFMLNEEKKSALVNAFLPLGVDLQFIEVPVQSYFSLVKTSDADLYSYSWIGDFADPLAFLELFKGFSTLNDSGWQNDDFDELLEKANLVSDEERFILLSKAEEILLDSAMVIPLYHTVSLNLIDLSEVGGWISNAFDFHPLKYLFKKETKSITNSNNFLLIKKEK